MISENFSKKQINYASFFTRIIASMIDCCLYNLLFNPLIRLSNDIFYKNKIAPNIFLSNVTNKFLRTNDGKINLVNFHIYLGEVSDYLFRKNMIYPILLNQICQLILILAIILTFWLKKQATPGKMLMKIKITNYEGKNLSLKQYLTRIIGLMITFSTLGLGYSLMLFNRRKQALHDLMAKNLIVKI